jgi:hypothetical protein
MKRRVLGDSLLENVAETEPGAWALGGWGQREVAGGNRLRRRRHGGLTSCLAGVVPPAADVYGGAAAKKLRAAPESSLFVRTLRAAGVGNLDMELAEEGGGGGCAHLVCAAPHRVTASVRDLVTADPEAAAEFLAGASEWLDDEGRLSRALVPLQGPAARAPPAVGGGLDSAASLTRALLRVDALQPRLVEMLLQRAAALSAAGTCADDQRLPKLLLRQLCWLESVADGAALVDELLAALRMCDPALRADAVDMVPYIVPDAQVRGGGGGGRPMRTPPPNRPPTQSAPAPPPNLLP